ncbi:MBL fold metallo-hydrolase [Treponema brennaborense]|uniref:Beta-lactamase domain protein n=1 Tax=Treponema brennaborense (strain DSM 12168 / CIP 105900 / DD5/3) TaxID=906968 RepID=F4LKH5_TREBD|nr:MBL fold metallo-hydrolase [Treponema brennaborense]AEE16549.1 beta-lactamase domain protein [Treponema brennaborense DSM 12168]
MQCVLLGTGTSHGIPVIGCSCPCCTSSDARDKRLRSSLWITDGSADSGAYTSIIIDTGPEFRIQALRFGIKKLDAVFLTHGHADHLNGLDDVRIFSHTCPGAAADSSDAGLPVYGNAQTITDVHERFSYIFHPPTEGGGTPKLHTVVCSSSRDAEGIKAGSLTLIPVPLLHGSLETTGWLVSDGRSSVAYLTDCSVIPDYSIALLQSQRTPIEHLIIDGLRRRPHDTHLSFDESIAYALRAGAKHIWLTHICHDMKHEEIDSYVRAYDLRHTDSENRTCRASTVAPAYDGLVLRVPDSAGTE